jgi:hypothetical protein
MDFLLKAHNISQQLSKDNRLTSSHVSLYLALLIVWAHNSFANSFSITRRELMSISKIGSFVTYHKCIKQLEEFGYIKYSPNFNSFVGSSAQII